MDKFDADKAAEQLTRQLAIGQTYEIRTFLAEPMPPITQALLAAYRAGLERAGEIADAECDRLTKASAESAQKGSEKKSFCEFQQARGVFRLGKAIRKEAGK